MAYIIRPGSTSRKFFDVRDALSKVQVPYEMHIYPIGSHGLGLAESMPHVAQWKDSLEKWIKLNGRKDI